MLEAMKALFVHCGLALALMFVAALVGVAVTGPSTSAAERTVMVLGIVDLVIALGTIGRFVAASAAFSSGLGRVVWALLCVGLVAAGAVTMFFITVLSLNR
jgi:hypothetical protein